MLLENFLLMTVFEVEIEVVTIVLEVPETVQNRSVLRSAVTLVRGTQAAGEFDTGKFLLEDDIHHAGDRVRAVKRGGAIFQYFHSIDNSQWQRRDIHERPLTVITQRIRRHAVAVDQNQRGIYGKTAQRHTAGAAG